MSISTTIENRFYELYLKYFHNAEAHRRWNVMKDIPWDAAMRQPDDAVAQIVESFMAVEMYLPDYTSKILHLIRRSRGRAWFQANWGYEESKHSLVLETWLTRSGHRTYEQLRCFEQEIFAREWDLCYDSPLEMVVYTTFQEFATGLNYRNLRRLAATSGDAALDRMLVLLAQDETAHFHFFKDGVRIFMDHDRDRVLEAIVHVLKTFRMPAQHLIPNWPERDRAIRDRQVFSDRIFTREVLPPVLKSLGLTLRELRETRKAHLCVESAESCLP
ncbi:MAG: acyl-ACP desaturase [Planctomycetes bacterium]|nr:acyl-ACP desaturase [Planctomycetota bacterium]